MNPDGRFIGQRANENGFDMNRDWLVQSQPEVRANLAPAVEWLAPVMFATHGYVNPTLIDGLTKPHNPGLEYDVFVYWNQRRLDANQTALARIGQGITRPVNGPIELTVPTSRTAIAPRRDLRPGPPRRSRRPRPHGFTGRRDDRRRRCRGSRLQRDVHRPERPDEHDPHLHDSRPRLAGLDWRDRHRPESRRSTAATARTATRLARPATSAGPHHRRGPDRSRPSPAPRSP